MLVPVIQQCTDILQANHFRHLVYFSQVKLVLNQLYGLVEFYDISTLVGYLKQNPVYTYTIGI